MLQALIKKGKVFAEDVPKPNVSPGSVLIKVVYSCISAGTEVAGMQAAKETSLIRKAMQRPEKVEKAWNMLKSDGFSKTFAKIRSVSTSDKKGQDTAKPTGYSLSGIVLAVGEGVTDIKQGDRVATAGAGIANHAEFVDVPRNLVMRIPDGLDYKSASTVTLGSIAMQGVRRANIQLGEFVVVYGTGILGLIAVQLVRAAGGRCIAVDLDPRRLELAGKFGAERTIDPSIESDQIKTVFHVTDGHGADAVIFTAATDKSSALSQALSMTRKKGRLVMVGVYGKEVRREDLYQKEIDFLISTSYGPGRYDENYEQKGLDYPYAYVRWTENRNMTEYLRLLVAGTLDIASMIEGVYPIADVANAFETLKQPSRPLLVLLDYGEPADDAVISDYRPGTFEIRKVNAVDAGKRIRVGIIGAGNFAVGMHLPNLQKLSDKYDIRAICSRTGHKAKAIAEQFGAAYATTDYKEILSDPEIDLTMICTRHNLHGKMVLESLQTGKHTFVEKPLCTNQEELEAIKDFFNSKPKTQNSKLPLLMVGFNRRFSKYAREVKKHVQTRINPLFIHYRMNAGYIPMDSWVHEDGGRIIGEACHIIDLFSYLIDAPVKAVSSAILQPKTESISATDNKSIILEYEDGSVATLEYFAVGSTEMPKEYMEVHFDQKTIVVEDYRVIRGYGVQTADIKTRASDKGQLEELECLREHLENETGTWPITIEDMIETTRITFMIAEE
ncbi:MAG: bi-domain-containing oxidoreductase [Deltaproteobacteria bacterium]|nr:bi-domain-containing oxidoreductase [Deltaproteobacteria bacterium]